MLKVHSLCVAAVVATALVTPSFAAANEAKAKEELVDDFSMDGWGFSNGGEFPGAKGAKGLSEEECVSAPTAMRVEYDFTGGGNYVGIGRGITIPKQVKKISFRAMITGENMIFMRVADSTGQTHATNPIPLKSIGAWVEMTVDLKKSRFVQHWQGAKDGVMHWPLRSIFIGPNRAKNSKRGSLYIDDLAFLVQGEWRTVKFPEFDLSTRQAHLVGRPTWTGYSLTLSNTSDRDMEATVELLDAPNGPVVKPVPWSRKPDIMNRAGPGSKFTHSRKPMIPAGKTASCSFPIDCPNWNPYNRYPLTCRLTIGDQVSMQTREIVGEKAEGILLGQPRNSKDIKESNIGVVYPWEHGALPKCLPMIAEAGIKWNRGMVRWVKTEETEQGRRPVGLQPRAIKYLDDLRANGINLIETDYIAHYETAEAAYTYFKGLAEVLKPYGVNHFEIGNEPNGHMPGKWGGNWNGVTAAKEIAPWIHKFVELVNAAAKGIKEVHPEATVIAGCGLNSSAHRALEAGLSQNVDGVSDHPYPYSITPELVPWGGEHVTKRDGYKSADDDHTFISQMRLLKEKAVKVGRPDMQIWLTEWGIPTHQYEGQQRFSKELLERMSFNVIEMGKQRISIYEGHTLNTQAKYLARRLIETLSIPDIVTKNFYFCFNRGPWFNKRNWERGGFSVTRTQDGSPKPSFHAMQRICALFSDGVEPVKEPLRIEVPLDRRQGRTGLAWKRPYAAEPVLWEGAVPMRELTTPRKYAFNTPQGELMLALWMPVRAEDWRKPDFCDVVLGTTGYGHPIAIDILTGERTDLEWEEDKDSGVTILKSVTVPDCPVVIKMFPKK